MLAEHLIGINWADFLAVVIIARMCYIGIKTGIGIELFKVIGLWLATVISFQIYTTPLSDALNERLPALPLDAGDFFVFVCLVTIVILAVRIVRESFFLLVKIEAQSTVNRWTGLTVGFLRGLWICSLVFFALTISTIQYLEESTKASLLGHRLLVMAPHIYKGAYDGLISKFFPRSKINEEVFKAIER